MSLSCGRDVCFTQMREIFLVRLLPISTRGCKFESRPGYKTVFMLISAETKIYPAHTF